MKLKINYLTTILLSVFSASLSAQAPIQLEEIMKGEDFIGHSPVNPLWSVDGQLIRFDWNPANEPGNSHYEFSLINALTKKAAPSSIVPSIQAGEKVYPVHYYNDNGNLARYNLKTKQHEIVFSMNNGIRSIHRVTNEKHVYFEWSGNLFQYDETSGSIRQITHFVQGMAPDQKADSIASSTSLYKEQRELFAIIREQDEQQKWEKSTKINRPFPSAVYYPKNEQPEDITISPDEQFITFRLSNYPVETETFVEDYITGDGYTHRIEARAKVGNKDPEHRLGIINLQKDSVYYVSMSGLADIRKRPAYYLEYDPKAGDFDTDRSVIMHPPVMHSSGKKALVDIRSYDNKDRWIVLLNLADGRLKELDHQHDEAWIGGPGISGWNEEIAVLGWLEGNTCYFQSEETGYSHLYTLNIDSKQKKAITAGNWEVHDVLLSTDKKTAYIIANKLNPGVRNGYRVDLANATLTPLFEGNFGMEWVLSPDEKKWAIRYSTSTKPWDLYLADNKPNARLQEITKTASPAFTSLSVTAPQVITFRASDGKEVAGRLYTPKKSNGAAVLFAHGAGYLQNAHHYWSNYYREFLFHQLLISKGYTVLDVDYRASEGYGRDYRTAVYRHMGERDLFDFVDARTFLVSKGIDSSRIGLYGGSYGGFLSLMGMLKTPGTFACAAGLRSVTDWEHYNHEYTSNILNYPGTDPKAYKQSSPIYFAEGLNGPLLMLHGMKDDNVQFQDIVRLNQRFIELGKTNFNLAVFPTETHGFKSAAAWTDEYRRILGLFDLYLKK